MKRAIAWMMALMLIFAQGAYAATASEEGRSITSGLPTDHEATIMVCQMDNEPGARPQKGIGSADIVYEVEIYDGGLGTARELLRRLREAGLCRNDPDHKGEVTFLNSSDDPSLLERSKDLFYLKEEVSN